MTTHITYQSYLLSNTRVYCTPCSGNSRTEKTQVIDLRICTDTISCGHGTDEKRTFNTRESRRTIDNYRGAKRVFKRVRNMSVNRNGNYSCASLSEKRCTMIHVTNIVQSFCRQCDTITRRSHKRYVKCSTKSTAHVVELTLFLFQVGILLLIRNIKTATNEK